MLFSITTYNRSTIATQSIKQLISIVNSRYPIFIQDDGSTENLINSYFSELKCIPGPSAIHINRKEHLGVEYNNIHRLDMLSIKDHDTFVYLTDDDIHYSNEFYTALIQMQEMMLDNPVFFAGTLFNVDGNKFGRHKLVNPQKPIHYKGSDYYEKESFGGCSVLIRITDFHKAMKAYKAQDYKGPFGWDWSFCHYAHANGMQLVTSENSYVQHVGKIGTNSSPHSYDYTDNFIQG